jgi:hypothetical protein
MFVYNVANAIAGVKQNWDLYIQGLFSSIVLAEKTLLEVLVVGSYRTFKDRTTMSNIALANMHRGVDLRCTPAALGLSTKN